MNNILISLVVFIAGLLTGLFWPSSSTPPANSNQATIAPEVAQIEKEEIKPTTLKVYKTKAKDKLPIPQDIKRDENEHVLIASKIKNDGHDHTVITVVNDKTGEATTIDHKNPLPWLAVERKRELRLEYGYKNNISPVSVFRLTYRADFIQSKMFHAGISTSLDSDLEYFIGAGISWKFQP